MRVCWSENAANIIIIIIIIMIIIVVVIITAFYIRLYPGKNDEQARRSVGLKTQKKKKSDHANDIIIDFI